jgi:hypothetical protein
MKLFRSRYFVILGSLITAGLLSIIVYYIGYWIFKIVSPDNFMDQIALTFNLIHICGIVYFLTLLLVTVYCIKKYRTVNREYYWGFVIIGVLFLLIFIFLEIIYIFHI